MSISAGQRQESERSSNEATKRARTKRVTSIQHHIGVLLLSIPIRREGQRVIIQLECVETKGADSNDRIDVRRNKEGKDEEERRMAKTVRRRGSREKLQ